MAQKSALCVAAGHFEMEDTVVLRAELLKCQERLAKYEAMLPDLVPRSAEVYQEMKSQHSHTEAKDCDTMWTVTLIKILIFCYAISNHMLVVDFVDRFGTEFWVHHTFTILASGPCRN